MAAEREDLVYIRHMRDACRKAIAYGTRVNRDRFLEDEMIQDATIRQREVPGEAAGRVGVRFQGEHPEVPWAAARRTRNVLIHDYASVSPVVVWDTVQTDLPRLLVALEGILRKPPSSSDWHTGSWRVSPMSKEATGPAFRDPCPNGHGRMEGNRVTRRHVT